jgi:hypothetical protein
MRFFARSKSPWVRSRRPLIHGSMRPSTVPIIDRLLSEALSRGHALPGLAWNCRLTSSSHYPIVGNQL